MLAWYYFGTCYQLQNCVALCLPGNPTSSYCSLLQQCFLLCTYRKNDEKNFILDTKEPRFYQHTTSFMTKLFITSSFFKLQLSFITRVKRKLHHKKNIHCPVMLANPLDTKEPRFYQHTTNFMTKTFQTFVITSRLFCIKSTAYKMFSLMYL